MTTRRDFIKNAALALGISPSLDLLAAVGQVPNLGIQLFSLPKMLETDFGKAIEMLAGMGYKELELFGPYGFSTEKAQASWAAVTPQLGFSGSGYFGKNIKEIGQILKANGLSTPSAHTDLDTLQTRMPALAAAALQLGHKYVVLPAIPDEYRKSLDDYRRIADTFNKIGESAIKNGIKFGYHNHGYGLKPTANGVIPLEIILNNTDPNLVFFELDVYWTAAGGANPVAYLEKYPNRYKMLHLKDMKEKKTFSGDGSSAPQWIELFPYMTTAGDGVLDLKAIVEKSLSIGVEHYFVEQDMVASPEIALKRSIDFLKKI